MNSWDDDVDEDWPDEPEFEETRPCPACGADVYEDSPRCPICGEYITHSRSSTWAGRPVWYVLLGLLGIIAVVTMLLAPW